jgi:hypothetical protein
MATARELGEAGERFSNFASAPLTSGSAAVHLAHVGSGVDSGGVEAGPGMTPGSAVFADPAAMRHDYDASKVARQEARRLRRIQRKTERGQRQALRDIDLP